MLRLGARHPRHEAPGAAADAPGVACSCEGFRYVLPEAQPVFHRDEPATFTPAQHPLSSGELGRVLFEESFELFHVLAIPLRASAHFCHGSNGSSRSFVIIPGLQTLTSSAARPELVRRLTTNDHR